MDLDGDQMDRIYDSLADLGIEVGSDEFLTDLPDDGEPPLEEIAEIEEEELVDPNTRWWTASTSTTPCGC